MNFFKDIKKYLLRSGYDDTHQAKKVLKSAESQTVGCLCLKLRNNSSFSADYSPGRSMSILKVTTRLPTRKTYVYFEGNNRYGNVDSSNGNGSTDGKW